MLGPQLSYVLVGAFFLGSVLVYRRRWWAVIAIASAAGCFTLALWPRERVTITIAEIEQTGADDSAQFWVLTSDGRRYETSFDAHEALVAGRVFECVKRGEYLERCNARETSR